MDMKLRLERLSVIVGVGFLGFVAGCPFFSPPPLVDPCEGVTCDAGETCVDGECVPEQPVDPCEGVTCDAGETCVNGNCEPPAAFTNANAARGGAMYDKFWAVAGVTAAEPTEDHPLWASRPDTVSNTRTGADTWRCKECHGWDYKGVAGAYGSGSHLTGVAGIFSTTLSAQGAFDLIKTDHGYGEAGLSDEDIWDLAKFVLEEQIDTDEIIDADGLFNGDAGTGQTLYDAGIGGNLACAICHGADGKQLLFDDGTVTLGGLANDNPWEVQHKVRFGQPGTAMPSSVAGGGTTQDVADLAAYVQTLPQTP